jgi:hypothetical protein
MVWRWGGAAAILVAAVVGLPGSRGSGTEWQPAIPQLAGNKWYRRLALLGQIIGFAIGLVSRAAAPTVVGVLRHLPPTVSRTLLAAVVAGVVVVLLIAGRVSDEFLRKRNDPSGSSGQARWPSRTCGEAGVLAKNSRTPKNRLHSTLGFAALGFATWIIVPFDTGHGLFYTTASALLVLGGWAVLMGLSASVVDAKWSGYPGMVLCNLTARTLAALAAGWLLMAILLDLPTPLGDADPSSALIWSGVAGTACVAVGFWLVSELPRERPLRPTGNLQPLASSFETGNAVEDCLDRRPQAFMDAQRIIAGHRSWGIEGTPGSGKSWYMAQLREVLTQEGHCCLLIDANTASEVGPVEAMVGSLKAAGDASEAGLKETLARLLTGVSVTVEGGMTGVTTKFEARKHPNPTPEKDLAALKAEFRQALDKLTNADGNEVSPRRVVIFLDDTDHCSPSAIQTILARIHLLRDQPCSFVVSINRDEVMALLARLGDKIRNPTDYLQKVIDTWIDPDLILDEDARRMYVRNRIPGFPGEVIDDIAAVMQEAGASLRDMDAILREMTARCPAYEPEEDASRAMDNSTIGIAAILSIAHALHRDEFAKGRQDHDLLVGFLKGPWAPGDKRPVDTLAAWAQRLGPALDSPSVADYLARNRRR